MTQPRVRGEPNSERLSISVTDRELAEIDKSYVRLGFKTRASFARAATKLLCHLDSETWADIGQASGVLGDVDAEVFWDSILGRVDDFQSNHDHETAVRARMVRVEKCAIAIGSDVPTSVAVSYGEQLIDALDARERELLSDKGETA